MLGGRECLRLADRWLAGRDERICALIRARKVGPRMTGRDPATFGSAFDTLATDHGGRAGDAVFGAVQIEVLPP
jgi:hypothetical protein